MNNKRNPTRCIDPILKYCLECPYGVVTYPGWVETYEDLEGCCFETSCSLGYDRGRPEDEPTSEEIAEFERWLIKIREEYKSEEE